jgi:prepilin-type N-terminal cleavage/methylation domain-containing protein
MLQKIKQTRGGFTLVEIMIVVAIIALLATLAIPNITRARLRAQATAVKNDLQQIDAAIDQYAIEKNVATGATVSATNLAPYVKANSRLATVLSGGSATDTLGNTITLPVVGGTLAVPTASYTALSAVTDGTFWMPFTTGT